ncbi:pol-like protein [Colletotrichum kahawae]|uniref:Pol-like protein n=1 Tax=Colletotrichum kahawae TaxID=34407 RepID=A0AAD9YFZ1_COLKA|nr:pol-like protein [Colletotrichum kahawae]
MDSPEGSANDAMTAEINRRVNEAVNISIRPLQDQITQLLTALNGLISTDRATPTPLISSILTPSTANITIQAISNGITMAAEGRKKPLPNPPKFTGRRKDYIAYNADIWYFINSCLNSRPQQVVATFYAAGEGDMMISSINRAKGKEKDIYKCFNYNQISHITIRYPKPKHAYPTKVKKAKKQEVSSDKSPIEELRSSKAKESSGKE